MTRKLILLAAVLIIAGLLAAFYPSPVEKPVKDGAGPNAITIAARYPAPAYHTPLERWQTLHMDALNRGDLSQADCLYCHEPEKSCNNCHDYVGVDRIVSDAAAGVQ